ncbi:hypothetical protein [Streptomyces sp. A10(2020)]|uniref:hypothetical protein n=1 Tax=Streptomyces sp. A10(2020) TaxID=2782013 RepID=UPI003241CABB
MERQNSDRVLDEDTIQVGGECGAGASEEDAAGCGLASRGLGREEGLAGACSTFPDKAGVGVHLVQSIELLMGEPFEGDIEVVETRLQVGHEVEVGADRFEHLLAERGGDRRRGPPVALQPEARGSLDGMRQATSAVVGRCSQILLGLELGRAEEFDIRRDDQVTAGDTMVPQISHQLTDLPVECVHAPVGLRKGRFLRAHFTAGRTVVPLAVLL